MAIRRKGAECSGGPTSVAWVDTVVDVSPPRADSRLLGITYTYVKAVLLYRSSDLGPAGSSDPEQGFGLTHEDGSAKPVWNVRKSETGVA